MTSTIKVNNIQNQCGANIINESSNTITIGASGDTIALASGASQTGFGRTGTVDWQTGSIKTATFTAANGEGYFCNTTSGGFTVNLPAGSAGAIVSLQDYNNTFDTNGLIVTPNGSEKINGGTGSVTLGTEGEGLTLVYIDGTVGWRSIQDNDFAATGSNFIVATGGTETTCGDFKIHTFTSPGNFQVTAAGSPAGSSTLEYIVVAGGGGGGGGYGGGGGAGGFRFASPSLAPLTYPGKPLAAPAGLTATVNTFPITIGAGGTGSSSAPAADGTRGSSSIFSTITSAGGGAGAQVNPDLRPGGSGGGGSVSGGGGPSPQEPGGTGNTPPVSPAQGTNGGDGHNGGCYGQGGGGGAIAAGTNGSGPVGGPGGDGSGIPTAFGSNGVPCGSFRYYAGGGGGGRYGPAGGGGGGGTGGKGGGGAADCGTAPSGTANSGGGGGGANGRQPCGHNGGAGGSGIVIIRYKFQ